MKTETLDEWKARTGKTPKKVNFKDAYSRVYSYHWLTKGKVKIQLKNKKGPVKEP